MPSTQPLPTIPQLLRAGRAALQGERDLYGDARDGSLYDHATGPMAILCSREADRDKTLFDSIYFANAEGKALTTLIQQRYASLGIVRILDAAGQGACTFTRPTDGGGATLFPQGTRVRVPGTPPGIYQVAADTTTSAAALRAVIPIENTQIGETTPVQTSTGLALLDPISDLTWVPQQLQCGSGTVFEPAPAFRARALAAKAAARNGYLSNMIAACQAAGAAYVLAFESDYGLPLDDFDDDFGLNSLYVADSNYESSPALVNACGVALEPWRVGGADLWVGGMATTPLTVTMLVALRVNPSQAPIATIRRACLMAVLGAFGATLTGFTYSQAALTGAAHGASPYVQLAALPSLWAAETAYAVGSLVVPSPANGQAYQCSAAGESGLGQPLFPAAAGATVADGSLVWTCLGIPGVGVYAGGTIQTTDPTYAQGSFPAAIPRYTLTQAAVQFVFTGPI